MSSQLIVVLLYLLPLLAILLYWQKKRKIRTKSGLQLLARAEQQGLTTPASLHPVIDLSLCIGCGSCVSACPEHNVLALIEGQAQTVNVANCIGHGECQKACPQNAIELVFGTRESGVDIPDISGDFQTNISGIFVAGELGGMGLIKNAIEQGCQVMASVVAFNKSLEGKGTSEGASQVLDCLIVGAGPAGLAAVLEAKARGLNVSVLEQDSIGGAISHFPRGKLVMTSPAYLPLVGKVKFSEISKEKLLAFWVDTIKQHKLAINEQEPVLDVIRNDHGDFTVTSTKQVYRAKAVILAIGRRGTPRKLNVDGEELTKVIYQLTCVEQYRDQDVLVVGGGDSALEAACSLAESGNCRVSLVYRGNTFSRAKEKNRRRVADLAARGGVTLWMNSTVLGIKADSVELTSQGKTQFLVNDVVIVCAGGVLPTSFLHKIGIKVTTKYGTA